MLGITGNPAFEALKVYLIKEHNAKIASGGKEIVKKCHICGDSRDPSSRHMYIGLKDGTIVKHNKFSLYGLFSKTNLIT